MKQFILILLCLVTFNTQAQISKVILQASGLTCSMCSNAIYKSLKSVDFVDNVEANIKNSSFTISFKPGSSVEIDQLKEKVEDAGFFVASLTAFINFNNVSVANDSHVEADGKIFHFLNVSTQTVNGEKAVKLLDKGYVTAKAFKQNSKYTTMACYQTGKAAACCARNGLTEGTRIYHVTL